MRDTNFALKTAGALTTTTNGDTVDVGGGDAARPLTYALVCTAASGTSPTLDVKIQESADDSSWSDLAAFPQLTGVGVKRVTVFSDKRYRRVVSTIAGTTPSFNFSVYGELGGQYKNF